MRILLLLSTTNADKAAVPAGYAHRLQMMMLFAQGLFGGKGSGARELDGDGDGDGLGLGGYGVGDGKAETGIDIAVSAEPRFLEKSVFLSGDLGTGTGTGAGTGNGSGYARAAQWWMLGFDTLRRLVDGKYYRPTGSLGVLAPLFEGAGNRILMVKRNGYAENDDAEQDEFVRALRFGRQEGGFQGEGWNAEWGERVDFVDAFDGGVQDGEGRVVSVSSTAAREGVREGNFEVLRQICGDDVAEYIQKEGLYIEG